LLDALNTEERLDDVAEKPIERPHPPKALTTSNMTRNTVIVGLLGVIRGASKTEMRKIKINNHVRVDVIRLNKLRMACRQKMINKSFIRRREICTLLMVLSADTALKRC
jgi:hypothetical protein